MDSDILFSLKAPLLLLHLRSAAGALEESWEEQQSSTVTLAALSKVDQQIAETSDQKGASRRKFYLVNKNNLAIWKSQKGLKSTKNP